MTSHPSNQLPPGVSPNHPLGPLTALIDDLRTHTRASAENGPSDDLGVGIITTGSDTEALVPIFIRSTWPPGAQSRHKLIWIKPSIPSTAFGSAINDALKVVEADGMVKETVAIWGGVNPFSDTNSASFAIAAREAVRCAVAISDPPTLKQIIRMMGRMMNGIMQVVVEPALDTLRCVICRRPRSITEGSLDDIRHSAFGPMIFCEDCIREHGREGIERIYREETVEATRQAKDSLGNTLG